MTFTAKCTCDLWTVFCAYCLLMWSSEEISKLIFTWSKKEKLHRKNNVNDKIFHCFCQKIENKIIRDNHNSYYVHCKSRLRVVPHFSSGIGERAKCECAWKSPHARKGNTYLSHATRDIRLFPHCVSPFLVWGDFQACLCFSCSSIPEEKWGTTHSLLQKCVSL